ncbi:AN1-type zinc finger and ubiquitin domain-containing protein 1 [Chelonia mydas]|uniref:AN1-type zinc finger and ubiquitin domain-containing protein 1 n=1 Tax=Chelonia mydas TaxID=8469 RepID=M7AVJ1_CHEMY|nr:AN1-type zinc finger and ubiquitin domain-containing protein 1 [Chelonia mydas]
MELFIETLTGTCFELRVAPFETVISVKAKIQRLEGIPVSQQHLIWNNVELEDDYCLNDYNISEGCTLKLVLAMRGGPINTRRVPVEDPIREMAEYMDPSRDEVWEKGPSNKQVTFLVYREGDQLNFFRVVDRGDGTLTPLSESLSGGSVYNLYADDDEESEASPSGQQIIENSITMNKMKLLKAKMENMNLSKKPKKTVKVKPRPPMTPRPSSSSAAAARHRFLRVLPHIGQSCLPPSGNSYPSESSQNALSALATLATAGRTMPSITSDFLKEDDNWESTSRSQSVNSIRLPPKISRVELENAKLSTNNFLPPVPSLPTNSKKALENVTSTNENDPVLNPPLTNVELCATEDKLLPETDAFALLAEANTAEQYSELYGIGKLNPELGLCEGDEESKAVEQHSKPITNILSATTMEAGLLNTRELSPPKNTLLSPLRYSAQMAHHSSLKPQTQPKCFESAHGLGMNGNVAASGKRVGEATHLPPVNGSMQTKKKTTKHCFLCGKKTGLATSYECRYAEYITKMVKMYGCDQTKGWGV